MFTTFRLYYMQDRIGLEEKSALAAVTTGVLIYTVTLLIAAYVAGWISDRTGRRKFLVAGSTLLFAIGIFMLVPATEVSTSTWWKPSSAWPTASTSGWTWRWWWTCCPTG